MAAKKIKRNPSARKAARQAVKRRASNMSRASSIKTSLTKVEAAIAAGVKSEAQAAYKAAESVMMRGIRTAVTNKNAVARKLSRLSKRIKALK
jgi:small subunit ribosomal protein S20